MRVKAIGRYSSGSPKRCWDDSGTNTPRAISTAMKQVFRQPISAVPNTLVLAAATSSGRRVRATKLITRVTSRSIALSTPARPDRA